MVGGELTVLTVADYLSYGYSTTWSVFTAGELDDAERREKRRMLETGLGPRPRGSAIDGRVLVGDAGVELAEASAEFDLLVTGSRGYGPLRRTILGSTTRQLVGTLGLPRARPSEGGRLRSARPARPPVGERRPSGFPARGMNLPAIETADLTKRYGEVVGVEALDLRVEVGEVFGFLGPNGAGKTTTIRMLLDLIRPTRGSRAGLRLRHAARRARTCGGGSATCRAS